MRILYLITRSEHGGAQSHLLQLVSAAARRGPVMVATGEDGDLCQRVRSVGVECTILRHLRHPIRPFNDAAAVLEISRLIRRFEPDLIHSHSGKAGLVGRLAAALHHVPSVYTAHGFAFADGAPLRRRLPAAVGEWIAARAGDFTIAVSHAECQLARRYDVAPGGRSAVIYNGVEESPRRAVPEAEPPVIAMVARFAYPKQQALLIRAFSRISGNARLWLIGGGPDLQAARHAALASGVGQRIVLWGDRDDVPELLAQVQIGALLSVHEGFGLSLIEAMSLGLPVIASDCGGMREIVRHGHTGLLVPSNNETELTTAIDKLVVNPGMRKQMGTAGLARFRANFTAEAMVQRTLHVYESLLAREAQAVACSVDACPHACQRQFASSGD